MSETVRETNLARSVTQVERFFFRSPFSIVTLVTRILGNVTREDLKRALGLLQKKHALLSVRVEQDPDHGWRFTPEGVDEIPLQVVRRSSPDDWVKLHVEASMIPFDFETRPAIRIILVHSPDASELIILCHHMICDGMSLAYIARDLLTYLGNPGHEIEPLPAPGPIDLDNLPADVSQSFLVKALVKRMNKEWLEEAVYFDQQDYESLTHAYWQNFQHGIVSIELSEQETTTLIARCRNQKVTVNSALTTAFAGAQSTVQGEQPYHAKIVVAASLRDRLPSPPDEGLGMYAGGLDLKFKYNHRWGFWENARAFHEKVLSRYTNKKLFSDLLNWLYLEPTILDGLHFKKLGGLVSPESPCYEKLSAFSEREDILLRILKRDNLETLEAKHWGTAVTNLGRLDFPRQYGDLELERLIFQPGGGIPLPNVNLVLGAVTCSGRLSLVVEYADQAVDSGTIHAIKEEAMKYLLRDAEIEVEGYS
jgi:NRPS condensation-like uncharacterized protein